MKDIILVIIIIIAIWVMWLSTGGSLKAPEYTDPSAPREEKLHQGTGSSTSSLFKDEVRVASIGTATSLDPNTEYIELVAASSNKGSVDISDWTLRNASGDTATIGRASALPRTGGINEEAGLAMAPGERVYINTGQSPTGVSFRVNACSGYLEQFQNFTPPLARSCPSAVPQEIDLDQSCVNYISSLPQCEIYTNTAPSDLSDSCTNYIYNNINYNSCVDAHANESQFYKPEWRVFLGKNTEFWGNKTDLIRLYDSSGNLVDSRSY